MSAVVAILSIVILVMASCGSDKPSAPAEKVVDLESLPNLFESGKDTVTTSCTTTDFQWMDCEGAFHPGTKFVPGDGKRITLQGEAIDLSKALGLTDSNELVLRDKLVSNQPSTSKPKVRESKPAPAPVKVSEKSESFDWSSIPWNWLGYILLVGLAALLLFFLLGLLRRLSNWMTAPLARGRASNGNDTPSNNAVLYNRVQFKDRGNMPTEFVVEGNFQLPLEVQVTIDGKVDTFRFHQPSHGNENQRPNNGGRR